MKIEDVKLRSTVQLDNFESRGYWILKGTEHGKALLTMLIKENYVLSIPFGTEVTVTEEPQPEPSLKYCPNCGTVYYTSLTSCGVREECHCYKLRPVT